MDKRRLDSAGNEQEKETDYKPALGWHKNPRNKVFIYRIYDTKIRPVCQAVP